MSRDNSLWGEERIANELLVKLGIRRREFGLSGQRRGTESDKEPPQIRFADITLPD